MSLSNVEGQALPEFLCCHCKCPSPWTPSPSRPPPNRVACASARGPETADPEMEKTAHREMVTAPLLPAEEGRAENILFHFFFCSAAGPAASGTQNINKRAASSVSWSREEESGGPCITETLPSSSLASRQQWVAKEHPSCPFVEPGKGSNTRVPASSRHTPGCHKPQAGFLRFLPHDEESGECYISHPDPAPCRHRPWAGSLWSTKLPHHRYVGSSADTVFWSLASAPQSVSVAPADHQTRLCDSAAQLSAREVRHSLRRRPVRLCVGVCICLIQKYKLGFILTLWSAAAGCELPHANVHWLV